MSTQKRNQLSEIMNLAWQMVRRNGYTMSEALKVAWTNIKLRALLHKKVVEFYFKKTDGTLRQAFGTLMRQRKQQITARYTSIQKRTNTDVSKSAIL